MELDQVVQVLQRTPATLRALLQGLSPAWTQPSGDRDSWDPYAVIGHLIHSEETNWIPRIEMILQYGESRPFEAFDRFAQFDRFTGQSLEQLLDTFAQLRRQNLAKLEAMHLTAGQLELRGHHPQLGAVTLHQLLAAWVVHDLNHVGQVVEAMSKRYTDDVGPWKVNLAILTR